MKYDRPKKTILITNQLLTFDTTKQQSRLHDEIIIAIALTKSWQLPTNLVGANRRSPLPIFATPERQSNLMKYDRNKHHRQSIR